MLSIQNQKGTPTCASSVRLMFLVVLAVVFMDISGCDSLTRDSTRPERTTVSEMTVPAGYYRANPGDSLGRIAVAFGRRPQDVARWNGLAGNGIIAPGQLLRVAPPATASEPAPPVHEHVLDRRALPAASEGTALIWPVQGRVISPYVAGRSRGMLIAAAPGEPVKAAADGRVVYAGTGIAAYGPLVIIKDSDGLITAYGQNERLLVKEDQAVVQGQGIAEAGTGRDGRGVLQFEVRRNGRQVDPLSLLPGDVSASSGHPATSAE